MNSCIQLSALPHDREEGICIEIGNALDYDANLVVGSVVFWIDRNLVEVCLMGAQSERFALDAVSEIPGGIPARSRVSQRGYWVLGKSAPTEGTLTIDERVYQVRLHCDFS